MKSVFCLLTVLCLATPIHAAAEGDPEAGKAKAATCAACHGNDGNSVNPEWPKIAGQSYPYLVRQIAAIKSSDGRKNELMTPMVSGLSDQDIQDLSAFFAAQAPSPGTANAELAGMGAQLYRGGNADKKIPACMGCHGPAGDGIAPAAIPRLAGQHAPYTIGQLHAYRSGARTTDAAGMMRAIAERMNDAEMAAVAEYVSGLRPQTR